MMIKILFSLALTVCVAHAEGQSRGLLLGCPSQTCEPCTVPCAITGFFTAGTINPVVQIGTQYSVTYLGVAPEAGYGLYSIVYNRPFCFDVSIAAMGNTAAPVILKNTTKSNAVLSIEDNQSVTFMAVPIS